MNVGTLIKRSRKEQKLTLKVVSEKASISESFLIQVENDVNSISVDTLVRICNAIGIDAGNLITLANKQEITILTQKSEWDDIDISLTGFVTRRFSPPRRQKGHRLICPGVKTMGKINPCFKSFLFLR